MIRVLQSSLAAVLVRLAPYILVTGAGLHFLAEKQAKTAFDWMGIYKVTDFPTWGAFLEFILTVRIPIPLNLAFLEFIAYQLTGSIDASIVYLYRLSWILAFLVVLYFARASRLVLWAVAILSVFFLWVIPLVHINNQLYDATFPCFILLSLFFLDRGRLSTHVRGSAVCFFMSGFFLSMTDLSRPFFIILLPCIILFIIPIFKNAPRRSLVAFLAPLVFISLTWHVYIFVQYGMITHTNHSGFNLHRSWTHVPMPVLEPEPNNAPVAEGRWNNLNTPEHQRNSERVQKTIIQHALSNPMQSMEHVFMRLRDFIHGEKDIYEYKAEHPLLGLYLFTHQILYSFMVLVVLCVIAFMPRLVRRSVYTAVAPYCIMLFITASSFFILAVGEHEEESRLSLSILPLVLGSIVVFWKLFLVEALHVKQNSITTTNAND